MKTKIYSNETWNSNMHLVSKYANILFEIKCETDINDSFCHEIENILDDRKTTFTKINRLTLTVFTMEYVQAAERLNKKSSKRHPIIVSESIISSILQNDSNLRKYEDNIKIRRKELENLILDFGNILQKLAI
ncbi:TPA: hypothetical protein QCU33_005441 [Bacillus cereus]|nr:hypothetical protein [Bacillus cereus]